MRNRVMPTVCIGTEIWNTDISG